MKRYIISGRMLVLYIGVCVLFLALTFLGNHSITAISQNTPIPQKHCVIIDAGHGYPDGGATSVSGVLESTLNLQIAQKTEAVLNLLGIRTYMLRETEDSVYSSGNTIGQKKVSDIRNRVNKVNAQENAILISIHQNYFSDSRYRGAQVFYADSESSKQFANQIQSNFVKAMQPDNHRLAKKATGVYLLEHIRCTAVLVECGFLSNYDEDTLLSDQSYQKEIASLLAISAANYLDRYPLG